MTTPRVQDRNSVVVVLNLKQQTLGLFEKLQSPLALNYLIDLYYYLMMNNYHQILIS